MIDLPSSVLVAAFANNALLAHGFGAEHLSSEATLRRALGLTSVLACAAPLATVLAWLLAHPSIGVDRSLALFVLIVACAALGATVRATLQKLFPRHADLFAIDERVVLLDSIVLAPAVASLHADADLLRAVALTLAAVGGFGLVLLALAAMRDRLRGADVPVAFRGLPIELVTVALMSLAMLGLSGIGSHA